MLRQVVAKIPGARAARRALQKLAAQRRFSDQFRQFRVLHAAADRRLGVRWEDRLPVIGEATAETAYDRHYVYHTAWAARVLAATRPAYHVDISSSLFFVAIASAFVPVRFYDFRPADVVLPGLTCAAADLLKLPFPDATVPSLSCMHVVEHVGLGRYGDPLDPGGDAAAANELSRVLAAGGNLLFVAPVGRPRVAFNAHRVYGYDDVLALFPSLTLQEFTLIPADAGRGGLLVDAGRDACDAEDYGCGCFWFQRPG
jgi:SAM-dependent methyltransferase